MLASATGATARVSLSEAFCLTSVPRIERSPWMSVWNFPAFFLMNPLTASRARPSSCSAEPRSPRSAARSPATWASWRLNSRTWASLFFSVVVNFCRLRTVPNRSPRLLASVWAACESLVMLLPSAAPLPLRLAALTSSRALSAPFLPPWFAPDGPRATESLFSAE